MCDVTDCIFVSHHKSPKHMVFASGSKKEYFVDQTQSYIEKEKNLMDHTGCYLNKPEI